MRRLCSRVTYLHCAAFVLLCVIALSRQQQSAVNPSSSATSVQSPPGIFPMIIRRAFDDNANLSTCAMGWKALAPVDEENYEYCVRVFSNLRMTWMAAEETCSHYSNAHLASFDDEQQLQYLDAIINDELRDMHSHTSAWSTPIGATGDYSRRKRRISFWTGLGQLCPTQDTSTFPDLRQAYILHVFTHRQMDGRIRIRHATPAVLSIAAQTRCQ
jgi:hypothetical protein